MGDVDDFPASRVVVWAGHLLGVFDALEASTHEHVAVQIAVGLDEEVTVIGGDGSLTRDRVVVIESGVPHAYSSPRRSIVAWADPNASSTQRLRRRDEPPIRSTGPLEAGLWSDLMDLGRSFDPAGAVRVHHRLVEAVGGDAPVAVAPDPRIAEASSMLRPGPGPRPAVPEVASRIGLSPSRFRTVFRRAMGVPPARYRAWWRFMEAARLMSGGASATEAAHGAGFADSAHFTRVFRTMTGMPPSYLQHPAVEFHLVDDDARTLIASA